MREIAVSEVDERDSCWEEVVPRFRVYLQTAQGSYVGGYTACFDIVGADILQVIDWAQRQAGQSLVYSIALVLDNRDDDRRLSGRGRGLVWLLGADGNKGELEELGADDADVQRRMLARRQHPVVVPGHDSIPASEARLIEDLPR